ncbi:hypothetical protein FRC01_004026 [Tulasnella sp. 417]|nr:hypothetical protein FRC01_004026 [Tulasnella sp. 417]
MSRSQAPATSNAYRFGFDPEIAFKIEGISFGLPLSQIKVSSFFRELLKAPVHGEGTQRNPIDLDKVSRVTLSQVQSFHRILNCRRFEPEPVLSEEQWTDALRLATLWDFDHIRAYAIKNLKNSFLDPLQRIQLAEECNVKEWLHPAYARLCARRAPLTAKEGQILGFERFAALCRIREEVLRERKFNVWVDSVEGSWELTGGELAFLPRINRAEDLK